MPRIAQSYEITYVVSKAEYEDKGTKVIDILKEHGIDLNYPFDREFQLAPFIGVKYSQMKTKFIEDFEQVDHSRYSYYFEQFIENIFI